MANRGLHRRGFNASQSGETFPVSNPADDQEIAQVACCDGADTRLAIYAANRALACWSKLTAKARAAKLLAWRDAMIANQDDLAAILSAEQGNLSPRLREKSSTAQVTSNGSLRKRSGFMVI